MNIFIVTFCFTPLKIQQNVEHDFYHSTSIPEKLLFKAGDRSNLLNLQVNK